MVCIHALYLRDLKANSYESKLGSQPIPKKSTQVRWIGILIIHFFHL